MPKPEFEELARMIKTGFDDVHTRIDGVEGKIDGLAKDVDKKIQALDEKVTGGFASVHRRMDDIADRLGKHEEHIDVLEEKAGIPVGQRLHSVLG